MHQYATIEDTVYFWVVLNNVSGNAADADSGDLNVDVRLGGALAAAVPTFSTTGTLLSHANYPNGCYEIAIAATAVNGFAAGGTYGVFATALVSALNPAGFVGSFSLKPALLWKGTAAQVTARQLRFDAMFEGTPAGAVATDVGNSTTQFKTNLAEATDDHYNGAYVVFYDGDLLGQSRKISDYNGTDKIIIVATAFTSIPADGTLFFIIGRSE